MSARAEIRGGGKSRAREALRYASGPSAQQVPTLGRLHSTRPADWRKVDAALAIGLLALVVIVGNLRDMPHGLVGFLEMRLSVKNALLISAFAWAWPHVMSACGLYAPDRLRTGQGEWSRLLSAGVAGTALAMVFPLTSKSGAVTPMHALLFGAAFVAVARLIRVSARAAERKRVDVRPSQVMLIGSGPHAAQLYRQLQWEPYQNNNVIGYVDSAPHPTLEDLGLSHLGTIHQLEQVLMNRVVDSVLIALPVKSHYDDIRQSLAACARVGVPVSYSADLFGYCSAHHGATLGVAPRVSITATPGPELLAVKRMMDIVGAIIGLVATAPLMLTLAVAIKLTSRGPVFFAQDRYGCAKRLFRMYKFRTMVEDAAEVQHELESRNEASGPVFKIRDDPRITPIGRFLRRTSLDELPQLWHVLTGEMTLVGPRPMATRDVGRFDEPWLMRRFSMRPGLTCLWQISGRSNLDFDQWIALDLKYIDSWSLLLDLQILLRTVPALIRGTGAM